MSRVGKLPIAIPDKVQVKVEENTVRVEGPKGEGELALPDSVSCELSEGSIVMRRTSESREARARHGLARKLVANLVTGASEGFSRTLEIVGVGYRADVKGQQIHLSLGFSHPIVYQLPPNVSAKVDRQTVLTLESSSKQILGEVCAQIRALRPPEPYKGKGVKYADEQIRRKAGKAAGAGGR